MAIRQGTKVQLQRTWTVGEHLNDGGFGEVYRVVGDGDRAVAKFVPQEPGADRELLFGDVVTGDHIIPVIDQGAYRAYLVLVMPEADYSLADYLDAHGCLGPGSVLEVLADVAAAMSEYEAHGVVHRDLSPGNVLYLDGRWVVSDFGIARYAEAATVPETRKDMKNAVYTAPERWRNETATIASDVYSLGVVAFELLEGTPPFDGQTFEELSQQHQYAAVPAINAQAPTLLKSLINECLLKAIATRPSVERLAKRIEQLANPDETLGPLTALQRANQVEVNRLAEMDQSASVAKAAQQRRAELVDGAFHLYDGIIERITEAIKTNAPASEVTSDNNGTRILRLGSGQLRIYKPKPMNHSWGVGGTPHIDVVAYGSIAVSTHERTNGYEGRSHSLWFCDAQIKGEYGWFETAFMDSPLLAKQSPRDPFDLMPGDEAGQAIASIMGTMQVAWPFGCLTGDNVDDFIERWSIWLASAATGQLRRPTNMPEQTCDGSWRRH